MNIFRFATIVILILLVAPVSFGQTTICVPQFADGFAGAYRWRTTLTIENQEQTQAQVQIQLRRSDGEGMQLMMQHRIRQGPQFQVGPGGDFPATIRERATVSYRSGGAGGLQIGTCTIQSQSRIQARIMYHLYGPNDELLSETAIVPHAPFRAATVHVDHTENGRVGLALRNASTTETATVTLELYSSDGSLLGSMALALEPQAHFSRFISESFANFLSDDVGYLKITSSIPICGLALRFRGVTLTEAPLFVDQ